MSGTGERDFTKRFQALYDGDSRLTGMQAALIAALDAAIAADSRTFSRVFAVPHAIVLREISGLIDEAGPLTADRRCSRTMRMFYSRKGQVDTGRILHDVGGQAAAPPGSDRLLSLSMVDE